MFDSSDRCEDTIASVLYHLNALSLMHRSAHWQVRGDTFYGDHLMFERMYEDIDDEIDRMAERIVAMSDASYVDPHVISRAVDDIVIDAMQIKCPFERLLTCETTLIGVIDDAMSSLDECSTSTLGWNDVLGAIASKHEEHIYILRSRLAM